MSEIANLPGMGMPKAAATQSLKPSSYLRGAVV